VIENATGVPANRPARVLSRFTGKQNGESRSVPMNELLLSTLRACRMNATTADAVFGTHRGTPYRSFRSAVERAVHKAGVVGLTFHDLRHTFASRLVMAGVDLPTVTELTGHKDIRMTLRYTHLTSGYQRRAVRALVQNGNNVPAMFTTRSRGQHGDQAQVTDIVAVGR
jgi:integrase